MVEIKRILNVIARAYIVIALFELSLPFVFENYFIEGGHNYTSIFLTYLVDQLPAQMLPGIPVAIVLLLILTPSLSRGMTFWKVIIGSIAAFLGLAIFSAFVPGSDAV